METNGHGDRYLRLKQESRSRQIELAGLSAALREMEICFRANADLLKKDSTLWDIDVELLAGDVKQAGKNAALYRDLLAKEVDTQAAIQLFENAF